MKIDNIMHVFLVLSNILKIEMDWNNMFNKYFKKEKKQIPFDTNKV